MKKSPIIFINKSTSVLHLHLKMEGKNEYDKYDIKNRKRLMLFPAVYIAVIFYPGQVVTISAKPGGMEDVKEAPAPIQSKFTARKIKLNHTGMKIKIICRGQVSVGSILDGTVHIRY